MGKKKNINIISESAKSGKITGPYKVFLNTCKGFGQIGQPYTVNHNIYSCERNWIHDSVGGFMEMAVSGLPGVVGPNIFILPDDIPKYRPKLKNCIYVHPSVWPIRLWERLGFDECKLEIWSAGIDIDYFIPEKKEKSKQVMVYFKEREAKLLDKVLEVLSSEKIEPAVINYGNYKEDYYLDTLQNSIFGIWLGRHESQGIAMLEALSAGLPLLVIDVNSLFEVSAENHYRFPPGLKNFRVTSAPYFSDRCGIIIKDIGRLEGTVRQMTENYKKYNPRQYILENLSLRKSAQRIVGLFDKLENDGFLQKFTGSVDKEFQLSVRSKLLLKINKFL
ncbi:hypothetical protein M1271_04080 [Patescibacteria group bacterium]|nr:hypothetical protein [Patescibacteria group bacterium]MCL5798053.1 hypothetical protein [Patescibacteria group bacterium]